MGYDIETVKEIADIPEGYVPQDPDFPGYWRFSDVGMEVMVEILVKAGVVSTDDEIPDFPEWPEDMDEEREEELEDLVYNEDSEAFDPTPEELSLVAEMRKILSTGSKKEGMVPWFKFLSSDGWIIKPHECELIVKGIRKAHEELGASLFDLDNCDDDPEEIGEWVWKWVSFNELASNHGGYVIF